MKNKLYYLIKSKVVLNIKGPNIERFIKRLKDNNINIINIYYIDKNINILIFLSDLEKVLKLKTIYDIDIVSYKGLFSFKNSILNNKFILISILICFILFYIGTSMIFSIDILTNDKKMKDKLMLELEDLGISKYKFKKDYNTLQIIKKKIKDKYRDSIEWIEIESLGTKYIVRYEERIKNKDNTKSEYRHIIAKRDAVIKSLNIKSGEVVGSVNTYVKKGDIIVSGYITKNDEVIDTVSSSGTVLGEVWYNVCIDYPYKYYEEKETGNKNKILVVKFLNKEIELFNFNKYKNKKKLSKTILKNNILPIKFLYQTQLETEVINESNTKENIISKALEYSNKKIESSLNKGEYISDYKILNKTLYDDYIKLNIFYSVVLDITDYQYISYKNS